MIGLLKGVGAAISFFGQAWCVSERGPVFPAVFNPLNTIFTTFFASIFLHEEMYIGRYVHLQGPDPFNHSIYCLFSYGGRKRIAQN